MSDISNEILFGSLVLLIVLSGFFSSSETGLMAINRVLTWAENSLIFDDIGFAFKLTFLNKCDELERPVVAEFYQRCFDAELEGVTLIKQSEE